MEKTLIKYYFEKVETYINGKYEASPVDVCKFKEHIRIGSLSCKACDENILTTDNYVICKKRCLYN